MWVGRAGALGWGLARPTESASAVRVLLRACAQTVGTGPPRRGCAFAFACIYFSRCAFYLLSPYL